MTVVVKTNIKLKMRQLASFRRALQGPLLRDAFRLSLDYIGQVSAADYFIRTGTGQGTHPGDAPTHPSKLTIRTGRLVGSMVGAHRFSSSTLASGLASVVRPVAFDSTEGFERGKKESIREVDVTPGRIRAQIGTEVPYGAKHEFGQRPFLTPAVEKSMPRVYEIIHEAIESDFNRRRI